MGSSLGASVVAKGSGHFDDVLNHDHADCARDED
jgi:hypothetical protein